MDPVDGTQITPGDDALIAVPSGQPITLQDVIWNAPGPQGMTLRFRFVAPRIKPGADAIDFEAAVQDIEHLCQTYALPRIAEFGPAPAQIIVSLADTATPFGEVAPDVTQFFEAFTVQDGICIWDIF